MSGPRGRSLGQKLRRIPEHVRALLLRGLAEGLGLDVSLPGEDRRLLEREILPYLAMQDGLGRILFVGCDWYTRGYARRFAGKQFWTIESEPARARYGAPGRHVTDRLVNLGAHFGAGALDAIVCNGVLGWGLDDPEEAERSLAACCSALREGGVLVLGVNDVPEKRVLDLERSPALRGLRPWSFPPFAAAVLATRTANRHVFSFYEKPRAGSG